MRKLIKSVLVLSMFLSCGCAYHFGLIERRIPGGYRQAAVPIFKNKTQETTIETFFTNSLVRQLERSQVATIVPKNDAEVTIEGEILTVDYTPGALKEKKELPYLPQGSVLATEYHVRVKVNLIVRRNSDNAVLWTSDFVGERIYSAPQVTTYGLNSVDPIYNLSARRQSIQLIAEDMMAEAHDKMTENF